MTTTDPVRARLVDLIEHARRLDALLARPDCPARSLRVCRAGVAIDAAAAELERLAVSFETAMSDRANESSNAGPATGRRS